MTAPDSLFYYILMLSSFRALVRTEQECTTCDPMDFLTNSSFNFIHPFLCLVHMLSCEVSMVKLFYQVILFGLQKMFSELLLYF